MLASSLSLARLSRNQYFVAHFRFLPDEEEDGHNYDLDPFSFSNFPTL
jgi:hypothetical protein